MVLPCDRQADPVRAPSVRRMLIFTVAVAPAFASIDRLRPAQPDMVLENPE